MRVGLSRLPLRAFAEHPHLSAALLFGLLVFAYLWPVLIGGKMLSPIATLYELVPWRQRRPPDLHGYFNPLLTDVPLGHYPWNAFARQLIHQGTFPAWNPHVFAGVPFFSNPQTVLLSPFSLPLWLLPLNYGLGVSAALKLWAAAFGTYLLVRELRLGLLPALLAGIAYGLCSFNITWLAHESLPGVAAMLPWTVWLVERVLQRRGLGAALGLVAATGVALTGGHPGTQVHILAATALYAIVRASTLPDLPWAERLRRVGVATGAIVLGVLLVAVMFVPELRSAHGTLGTQARLGGTGSQPGVQMPLSAIRTVLFPDWWGRPSASIASDQPVGTVEAGGVAIAANFNERTFYAGVVALLLAVVAVVSREGWRRKAPFATLGALALAIPLHAPGLYWLVAHLPVFDVVQNQRMHFVFELAVAVLAGFGLEAVLRRPLGERRRLAVPVAGVTAGVVGLSATGASSSDVGHVLDHFATGADFGVNAVLALTSVVWFLLFAVGVALALLATRRWPRHRVAIAAAVVLMAALDMLHFAHGYQPMGPASKLVPPRTTAIAYLQRHARQGRFVGLEHALTNDYSGLYGIDDVRGYDPPQPTLRFYRLWLAANSAQWDWEPFTIEGFGPAAMRVVSVLGARYIVADAGVDPPSGSDPALRAIRRVYAGSDATIFVNARAMPRTMVAPAVVLTANETATRAALVAEGFDPRRTVVVERDQPGVAALAGAPPAHGTVVVSREKNADVTLRASLDRRGLVVLGDDFTDGWSVRVDGHRAQAAHVDDVLRGVVVDPGRHEVVWSYAVPGLRTGLVVSLVTLASLLGVAVLLVARRVAGGNRREQRR